MTATRHARGEWRPFFENWPDGPDFQRLTPPARLVLYTLKIKLGAAGIRAIAGRHAALAEWTGYTIEEVAEAERELENEGWIELEGAVAWLVRGLEFEPTMTPNDPKHRKWLARYLPTVPSYAILKRFAEHYAEWLVDQEVKPLPKPLPRASEGPSKGHRSTSPSPSPSPSPLKATPPPPRAGAPRDNRPKTEADRQLRRFCDSAEVTAVVAAAGEKGGSALLGYLRAAHDPPRLWLELKSYLEGPGAPGGRPVTAVQLGEAMHAMAMADPPVQMGQRRLAAFVRKVVEDLEPAPVRPSGPRRVSGDDFHDELLDAGKRLDAEAAEKRRASHAH